MPRVRKSREQLANEFFVSVTEIGRLFAISRKASKRCFDEARRTEGSVSVDLAPSDKVRLKTVLELLGISETELREKIKDPSS